MGRIIIAIRQTSPDFSAILIIPSQKAIIPISENAIFTESSAPVKIEFTTSGNLPFIAPKIIGDNSAKSSYEGRDILDINDSKQFDLKSSEIMGGDILLVYKANKKGL